MLFENFQRNLFIGHKTNFVKQLKLSTKVKLFVLFYVITEFNEKNANLRFSPPSEQGCISLSGRPET